MSKSETIIAEFEELLKVKEFHRDKNWLAFDATVQAVLRALSIEYNGNLKAKLDRWVSVTNARYFKHSLPVSYYFQSKMLYRDGFYEAAIILTRSICEMICYDRLVNIPHPFGSYEQLELENFRTLVKFIALPKSFGKEEFEKRIIQAISSGDVKNFIKSSYSLDKITSRYVFKIENGKEARNLNRFHQALEAIPYTNKEYFPDDTFALINKVYDDGNTYVHARRSPNKPKIDALTAINGVGKVLAHLYNIDGPLTGKTIVSGYADFPDICQGTHFGLDAYLTPEDAMRGYYNLPSQKQINKMLTLQGKWKGEWKHSESNNQSALLTFVVDGEYLKAVFQLENKQDIYDHVGIKCFGDYFHIIIPPATGKGKPLYHFEFEFLSDSVLVGQNLSRMTKSVFNRI